MQDAVLSEVTRGGLVESVHRGSVVLLATDGRVQASLGDVTSPMYPRSSLKPAQAAAMVRHGLQLEPRLLALASASHSGSEAHVAGVQEILAMHGQDARALRCVEGLPAGSAERDAYLRAGGIADRLHFNCSGKHAGFIATAVINGWDVATYLDADHPMQVAARERVEALSGEAVASTTVDGCGAPLFAISLTGLARAIHSIAVADIGSPEGLVGAAMRAHPEMVGGIGRDDTVAMQLLPGLIAKGGAEGVTVMALPDGRACAVKVSDGSARGHQPVVREVLRAWGLAEDALARLPVTSVLGGGRPMGSVGASAAVGGMLSA